MLLITTPGTGTYSVNHCILQLVCESLLPPLWSDKALLTDAISSQPEKPGNTYTHACHDKKKIGRYELNHKTWFN